MVGLQSRRPGFLPWFVIIKFLAANLSNLSLRVLHLGVSYRLHCPETQIRKIFG